MLLAKTVLFPLSNLFTLFHFSYLITLGKTSGWGALQSKASPKAQNWAEPVLFQELW